MRGLSRCIDAFCIRLLLVGLLFTSRFVYGLVATTKRTPAPFTKSATLPSLKVIPVKADWESDVLPSTPRRDYSYRLPIVYTNDLSSVEEWIDTNLKEQEQQSGSSSGPSKPLMLGWDMESSPRLPWRETTYTKDSYFGPATLQLSTPKSALVLQIAEDGFGPIHEHGLPRMIHDLLEDPLIIPVGVGIDGDMVELYRWCLEHGDDCAGPAWGAKSGPVLSRFDMGGIGSDQPGRSTGLARLVAGVLGVVLPKSNTLARTHWSKTPLLSKNEVSYAARDAWAGAAILEELRLVDPDRFDPSSIARLLQHQTEDDGGNQNNSNNNNNNKPLRSIQQISNRQILRKVAKTEWKELKSIKNGEGEENLPWTDERDERFKELTKELKTLAPTPAVCFEVTESLGINIP